MFNRVIHTAANPSLDLSVAKSDFTCSNQGPPSQFSFANSILRKQVPEQLSSMIGCRKSDVVH